jgi:4-diphosphocytidyl-2-C-methyl-D-erythritol kinase
MLVFPNCKINLGLNVISRRPDGFHTIETVFYPVFWQDALEVIENKKTSDPFTLAETGNPVNGPVEQNIIYKAWRLISSQKKLPRLTAHLHKHIPMGAGLGGGSSDAASFINLVNEQFKLGYTEVEKVKLASQLGSDCAFFIQNKPAFATGKGDELSEIRVDLSDYYLLVVYPGIHSDTASAYQALRPQKPVHSIKHIVETLPVKEWKNKLLNDFEITVFKKYPVIGDLKQRLYDANALYAGMSGSGSSVYGIFEKQPSTDLAAGYEYYLQKPRLKIL